MAHCVLLSSEEDVVAIADAWRGLHARVGLSPFTDYDWAMTWWRLIAKPEGAGILVAACYDGDRLVALLPFSIRLKYGVKVLRLIGHEVFYYRNFLFETPDVVPLAFQAVMDSSLYDCAQIKNIHEGTPEDAFMANHAYLREATHVHHMEHAGKTEATLFDGRSSSTRRHFKNIAKTVRKTPDLAYHFVENEMPPAEVMDFLLKRKKAWTVENKKHGIFSEPACDAFYRQVTALGALKKNLFFNWLVYQGKIVAAAVNFTCANTVYFHTATYDPLVAQLKAGLFLCLQASVWGAEKGFAETNYMEGEEDYKQRFSRLFRVTKEYVFCSTLKGKVFLFLLHMQLCMRGLGRSKPQAGE